MNRELEKELNRLRSDYLSVDRAGFEHFYCPILFRDDKVELCKAHIINQATSKSDRAWTVQRKDVDGFYGSRFEADFLAAQRLDDHTDDAILTSPSLRREFRPKLLADGKEIDFYLTDGELPSHFTPLFVESNPTALIGLKLNSDEALELENAHWRVRIVKDFRVSSLAVLIKASYLTMFKLFGYRYALSAAGHFIGRQILGDFFESNSKLDKKQVLENAKRHFKSHMNMIRPVVHSDFDMQGTVSDRKVLICWSSSGFPWATVIFVRFGETMHSVLLPVTDHPDSFAVFQDFLENRNEEIAIRLGQHDGERWNISRESLRIRWPKSGWGPELIS